MVFPSEGLTTQVLGPCKDRLYVATDPNKDDLVSDLQKLTADKSKQSNGDSYRMSLCVRKPTICVLTSSDTNQPVQSQKQARSLKFRI